MRRVDMVGVILAGTLLAGCAGRPAQPAPGPPASPPPPSAPAQQPDPVALIGLWKATGAGEEPDTVMRISAQSFELFRRCHSLSGSWDANEAGLFVGAAYSGSPGNPQGRPVPDRRRGCESDSPPRAAGRFQLGWLARVTAFRADGPERLLLDGQGRVVVRLQPGARSVDRPDKRPEETGVPTVTDEVRRAYAAAAPLPALLTPVTAASLLGRWQPDVALAKVDPLPPYVEFRDGGQWKGSDGCNGQGGQWAAGPAGAFVATSGISTMIGCDNVPVAAWMDSARRVGLEGKMLVLLDGAGKEVGRLRRDR